MAIQLESENGAGVHVAAFGTVAETTPTEDPMTAFAIADIYQRGVVLDMRGVKVLNSHGVGWLLRTHKLCEEAGGKFVLHSVPRLALDVLRMMQLTDVLRVATDDAHAEEIFDGESK